MTYHTPDRLFFDIERHQIVFVPAQEIEEGKWFSGTVRLNIECAESFMAGTPELAKVKSLALETRCAWDAFVSAMEKRAAKDGLVIVRDLDSFMVGPPEEVAEILSEAV